MMVVLFPIAFPLAKLLDCVLGKEHDVFFRRAGMAGEGGGEGQGEGGRG